MIAHVHASSPHSHRKEVIGASLPLARALDSLSFRERA